MADIVEFEAGQLIGILLLGKHTKLAAVLMVLVVLLGQVDCQGLVPPVLLVHGQHCLHLHSEILLLTN
jgi:hypothetical protein